MIRLYAITSVATIAALLAGSALYIAWRGAGEPGCASGQVVGGAIGGPFTLVDHKGATVTDAEVLAKPALVYFGYTFCPDVCPLDNARNAQAVDLLQERGFDVTPVFISIDPARDTPQVLAGYVEALHPRMIGLTGSPEQIKAASLAYKTYYKAQEGDADYYLVDHSTYTYLMLPGTGFAEFFPRDATAEDIADHASCFLAAS